MDSYREARRNMVESQIRPNQVTDERLLRALLEIPRENFVPASLQTLAYMEDDIPVSPSNHNFPGRSLITPMSLSRLIQLAEVEAENLVLDVGCATGYSSALLSRIAESVVGLECDEGLAERASQTLMELGADNAAVVSGPLPEGYPSEGPFDVILLNGCVPDVPEVLLKQLTRGGRLVAIIAEQDFGQATVFRNLGSRVGRRAAFDAGAPQLPGFEREKAFVF